MVAIAPFKLNDGIQLSHLLILTANKINMSACDLPNIFLWNSGRSCQWSWLSSGGPKTFEYTHTHAPCTARETHTQPVKDISTTAANAQVWWCSVALATMKLSPDPIVNLQKSLFLWHRIMAGGRSDIAASPIDAGSQTVSIRPRYQWMQRAALATPKWALPFTAG